MKTLHLIRHFKSSWENELLSDYERPLNDRGQRDLPRMGEALAAKGINPDVIWYSPAKRTEITCFGLRDYLNWENKIPYAEARLYGADVVEITELLHGLAPVINEVLVIGHNPTLTEAVNLYSTAKLDNLPTGGWVKIELDINDWSELDYNEQGELVDHLFPKMIP